MIDRGMVDKRWKYEFLSKAIDGLCLAVAVVAESEWVSVDFEELWDIDGGI